MDKLKDLCSGYQASGLYTHVYVACGFLDAEDNILEHLITPDGRDVFDLSSVTKALVTTPLVHWVTDSKGRDLKTSKLSDVFGCDAVESIGAMRHDQSLAAYLRHETGLPAWRNYYVFCDQKRQSLKESLSRMESKEGSQDVYSDVGFITLGALLENTHEKTLINLWRSYLVSFGINTVDFIGSSGELENQRAISSGFCPVRNRELVGEVHDENCWALGGYTGHSGLFATGTAVSSYLRSLWQCKVGRGVFESNFAEATTSGESLMGWRKGRDESSAPFALGRGCGHLGFTGTAFWADPVTRSYAVVLTNRIISARISPEIKTFRAKAFSLLWENIQATV